MFQTQVLCGWCTGQQSTMGCVLIKLIGCLKVRSLKKQRVNDWLDPLLHPDKVRLAHYHFTRRKQTATYARHRPLVLYSKIFIKKALLSHELPAICQQKMSPVKDIIIHRFQNAIWYSCLPSILTQIHSCGVRSCSVQNETQLLSCPFYFVCVAFKSVLQ